MVETIANPLNLDRQDLRILGALSRDGRISWSDLATEIGLSLTPTLRRVRRLEQDGVIQGYTAKLDETRLIGSMAVFISVTLERQVDERLIAFETSVLQLPEVMGGYLMSGGADYLLHAFVRDLDHYRVLLGKLTRLEGMAHLQSSFVLKTFVARSAPLLD
ncbi:MAG: transcriptional regulator, AsnC family [Sphingomonadales bacterium]|nr:transcriptional regulator, AsnC family [Sphingomonadales bacterium]